MAQADEVKTGPATILSNISGDETQEYAVEIVKIYPRVATRNLLIRVTDSALLEKTGGIVQGMSGQPDPAERLPRRRGDACVSAPMIPMAAT